VKILVIKISSLGDIIHSFAFINQVVKERPDAVIDFVAGKPYIELVKAVKGIRKVIPFNREKWGNLANITSTSRELLSFIGEMRAEHYDCCIDLQGLLRSGLITLFSGANKRAGFGDAREGASFVYNLTVEPVPLTHAVDKLLTALPLVDVDIPDKPDFSFNIPSDETENAKQKLKDIGVAGGYGVFHAGARWKTKMWREDYWRELAKETVMETGLDIVFTGSSLEGVMIERITGNENHLFSLAGKLNLLELASVLKNAEIAVSVDSGPMHIASALSTPLVALFGTTSPERTAPRGNGKKIIMQSDIDCLPCLKRECPKDIECMDMLKPSRVKGELLKLL